MESFLFIFYDCECKQDKLYSEYETNLYQHEVNLCVMQQVCQDCIDSNDIEMDCKKSVKGQHVSDVPPN